MSSHEGSAQYLSDVEEIRHLKLKYAELCDTGYDPDALTALFTEDGVFEAGDQVRAEGYAQLRQHWINVGNTISFALHFVTNHLIEVDGAGTTAVGRPYILGVTKTDGVAYWQGLRYQQRYRKVDGRWYFTYIRLNIEFNTPYDKSWADQVGIRSDLQ